jgi:hypothetical protein
LVFRSYLQFIKTNNPQKGGLKRRPKMKTLTLALATLLVSAAAHADGFVCQALDADLTVKVFNKTHAIEGTRTPSIMILSNPTISLGRKTIATFSNSSASLEGKGTSYFAEVNPENAEASRGGELIAGTKLGYVESLELHVDFNYYTPTAAGKTVDGALILTKLNGEHIPVNMECTRYLKGE